MNLFRHAQEFYIDGRWVSPRPGQATHHVIDPVTEEPLGELALGSAEDVDAAVQAAQTAFERFSQTRATERIALLDRILQIYNRRIDEFADAIALEIGAPLKFAREGQAFRGTAHLRAARDALMLMETERRVADTLFVYEPIGVCGLITPWNWPMNSAHCQGRAGDRRGVFDGCEAKRILASKRAAVRRGDGRSQDAARRLQPD